MLVFTTLCAQNFKNQSDLQWVCVPNHSDWNYKSGENATVSVLLLNHGMPAADVEIRWGVASDCERATLDQKIVTDKEGRATIKVKTPKKPGFLDVQMACRPADATTDHTNHIKVGFSPETLKPVTKRPADFEQFWSKTLDNSSAVKVVEVKNAKKYSTDEVKCTKVKLEFKLDGVTHYIYGYLSQPRDKEKHPVLISPPGAGVKPMDPLKTQFYAKDAKMIRLDLEIHGIDPALSAEQYKDITTAFGNHTAGGYLCNGIQSRETYYMRHVYVGIIKAVDYLTTLKEWDGKNILVQGNSQGAALSLMLAALDNRITAVACAHPALSDMAGCGYPHFGNTYKEIEVTPQVLNTLAYYDVTSFAPMVKCPVYMTWGYNDNTCPPTTSWMVWNLLTCEKEQFITPITEHWISTETRWRQLRFLQNKAK